MNIPKQLIDILNSGRCLAIVGSGPSSEMGYPSWPSLAATCATRAENAGASVDPDMLKRLMNKKDFPMVFSHLEENLGRAELVKLISSLLVPKTSTGKTYEILSRWPIRAYLTTNWDSALKKHLAELGLHFATLSNSRQEITQITDETTRQIIHLHGVLDDPSSLVLTDGDYTSFKTSDDRRYFRETLKSILRTLPAIIVGHSMSDPDIQTVLEAAKQIAPSHRPVYMIVGDLPREEQNALQYRYNIHAVPYRWDPTYNQFYRLLSTIDKFVVSRKGSRVQHLEPPPQDEIEAATSLLVYNSLSRTLDSASLLDRLVRPQVLQQLRRCEDGCSEGRVQQALVPESLRTLPALRERLTKVCLSMAEEGLIIGSTIQGWRLTPDGEKSVSDASMSERVEDDQIYGALRVDLQSSGVSAADAEKACHSLKNAVLSVFRRRGIAAASFVFRGQNFEPVDMAEFFEAVTSSVSWSDSFELRERFVDFAVRLFSNPTTEERRYLARVSQGLFAVHLFGIDPVGAENRAQILRDVSWYLDSNVLIHLLADGARSHVMATSLAEKCEALGIRLISTKGLVEEAMNSLAWAEKMCEPLAPDEEMAFIYRVYNQDGGFRPNPYIDGYVATHDERGFRRFAKYAKSLKMGTYAETLKRLDGVGVEVSSIEDAGALDGQRMAYIQLKNEILVERESRGTDRGGEFQAHVEAEVLCRMLAEREERRSATRSLEAAYFVSSSRLFDHLFEPRYGHLTWAPEILVKHLSLLAPSESDPESLIEALWTDMASLGITLVDQESYRRFFDPLISSSRMSFQEEKDRFVASLEADSQMTPEDLQREYESVPDLQKPRFVAQLLGRQEVLGLRRLEVEVAERAKREKELEAKLKQAEREFDEKRTATVEHFQNRIRNLTDPARRDKLSRKQKNKERKKKKK
ncbi:MAG TPA: SIR2 family protein [Pirellulaceae bacterium]|jgi:hypothetical protein|nr:SIR2 family protein [Pirellulaceae bacterium]